MFPAPRDSDELPVSAACKLALQMSPAGDDSDQLGTALALTISASIPADFKTLHKQGLEVCTTNAGGLHLIGMAQRSH